MCLYEVKSFVKSTFILTRTNRTPKMRRKKYETKTSYLCYLKDLISVKYIFWQIFKEILEIKIYIGGQTTFAKSLE